MRMMTVEGYTLRRPDDGIGWEFDCNSHRIELLETTAPGYRRAWEARAYPLDRQHESKTVARAGTIKAAIRQAIAATGK
jgi:hypothetical protein